MFDIAEHTMLFKNSFAVKIGAENNILRNMFVVHYDIILALIEPCMDKVISKNNFNYYNLFRR